METERNYNLSDMKPDKSLEFLASGYLDYSYDVIQGRALPAIDGFKPSQRRIMYTLMRRPRGLSKSGDLVGDVLKLHPHGDTSIYGTLCNMVDTRMSMTVPYLDGKGTFGRIFSVDPPAAMRYTEVELSAIMEEFREDLPYVDYMPSYDYKFTEPELMPSPFPNILTNPQRGIAVGISTNMPSFNFHDVIKGTIEVIKSGKLKTMLVPDFATGGNIYVDKDEIKRLNKKGKGKIFLRGDYHIEGNTIVIDSLPYYTTTEEFLRQVGRIAERESDIRDYRDEFGKDGFRVAIDCRRGSVDKVFKILINDTRLQMSLGLDFNLLINGIPEQIGVEGILQSWVDFRRKVLNTKYPILIGKMKYRIEELETLISIIEDKKKLGIFFDKLKKSEKEALAYLIKIFPKVDKEILEGILELKVRQFANVELRVRDLKKSKDELAKLESEFKDLDKTIIKQLQALDKKYKFPRLTKITKDWLEYEIEEEPQELEVCRFYMEGKFMHYAPEGTEGFEEALECVSNDVITLTDSLGRVLRVDLATLDYTNKTAANTGEYLPRFLELEDDDFEIMSYNKIAEDTFDVYLYDDCYISRIDYGEWVGAKRVVRVMARGVAMPDDGTKIKSVISLEKPYNLVVGTNSKGNVLLGLMDMSKVRYAGRLSRTRGLRTPKDFKVENIINVTLAEAKRMYKNIEGHIGVLKATPKATKLERFL